jgi:hypothetical protein
MKAYNTENFMNMSIGMEQVTTNYLEGEQRLCDSWAAFINSRKMNMSEAMQYLKVAQRIQNISAHIINLDSLTGYSNKPKIDEPGEFKVSYQEIDIFSSINELLGQQDQVRVTRSYTNPMNGIQSIAFCDLLELKNDDTHKTEKAVLMRVIPVDLLYSKWVFPSEKYSDAQISIIDREGNYIIKGKSFKNSNFFEFYKSYNKINKENLEKLQSKIHETGMLTMHNSKVENCLIAHVPVNSSFDWTLLSYIPMTDIARHNIDWPLVLVVTLCLLVLLIFDILVFMIFNRKLAAAAQEAESASRAKTDFLSAMSHDIRTPMNAIIGYINIAEKEAKTKEELFDYLAKIKGSSHHLLALINDVLEMSRIESGKMELELVPVNLKRTIADVYTLFETQMAEKHIDFIVDVDKIENCGVYCDRNRLNRVLLNLVSNAYKFTPEHGKVSFVAKELTSA